MGRMLMASLSALALAVGASAAAVGAVPAPLAEPSGASLVMPVQWGPGIQSESGISVGPSLDRGPDIGEDDENQLERQEAGLPDDPAAGATRGPTAQTESQCIGLTAAECERLLGQTARVPGADERLGLDIDRGPFPPGVSEPGSNIIGREDFVD